MFFFRITLFAARYDVSLGGPAATDDRDQVIHSEFSWRESLTTVVTDSPATFSFPPLSGTQLPTLLPLAPDLVFTHRYDERGSLHTFSHSTAEKLL